MKDEELIAMANKSGAFIQLSSTPKKDLAFLRSFANLVLDKARATDVEEATFKSRQQNEQMRLTLQTISRIALANSSQSES
jgi:hypothetical protein